MFNHTIAAIATPLGPGGIGIIRISGPSAYAILKRLFVRQLRAKKKRTHFKSSSNDTFRSHMVYHGYIMGVDRETIIDEVLAIFMQGPKSFTREDVVEIQSHSGFIVLNRILSAIIDAGAGLAMPGEFTKRAFLNGRIDISQAEAVIDLINAPCETAAQMASHHLTGGIRDIVQTLTFKLNNLQAKCEAAIEFLETGEDRTLISDVSREVRNEILPGISKLIQRQKETAIFRKGLHLAIAGSPNVGKSSLLNRLVEREAAIVSDFPGTTRDVVREYISINGIPVVVCDTAGIHETSDPVECMGIEKSRNQIHHADIVLMVLDGTRDVNAFEEKLLTEIKEDKTIVVVNKDDVVDEGVIRGIEKRVAKYSWIRVSAKTGTRIDQLKSLIFKDIVHGQQGAGDTWAAPNLRQRKILEKTSAALAPLTGQGVSGQPIELVSERLKHSLQLIGEISGVDGREDLYDHIFNQFCVGK
ncbi:tRNA modification GTPase MnmE [Desulfosarcina alkanivorans]|uniref:tRNA modification GTPase MnmE n=1 Tax=Desulfosarcina alkanivorans TaxID=571177 RepID=A0A5K7YT57_9BACT|nr:tRNA uridine-5-carboxymethylaminomethyl(34) synthesis GTPase MnmE [Desulfosarcina alkanivorans]BBO70201.1 tRNA modification GTPase MnmE [Desulfosarcina alkanivorans]